MELSAIAPYALGALLVALAIFALVAVTLKFPGRWIASVPVTPNVPATLAFTSPGPRQLKGDPNETGAHVHAWLYLSLQRVTDELMGVNVQIRVEIEGAVVTDASFPIVRGLRTWDALSPLCARTAAGISVNSSGSGTQQKAVLALAPIAAPAGAAVRVTVLVAPHASSRVVALRLCAAQPELETWRNRFVVDPHMRDHDLWLQEIDAVRSA